MFATIKLAVDYSKLILVRNQMLVSGNSNSVFIEFDLRTDDWMSCDNLRAVFNDYYVRKLDNTLKCDIPQEVLVTPGEIKISLYGIKGDIRLSTNKITFYVEEGCNGGLFSDSETIDPDKIFIVDGGDENGNQMMDDVEHLVIYDGGGVHGF